MCWSAGASQIQTAGPCLCVRGWGEPLGLNLERGAFEWARRKGKLVENMETAPHTDGCRCHRGDVETQLQELKSSELQQQFVLNAADCSCCSELLRE